MYAQFNRGLHTQIFSYKVTEQQNVASTFTLEVPLSELYDHPKNFMLEEVKVHFNQNDITPPLLLEDWKFTLASNSVIAVSFTGVYGFGFLTYQKAKQNAYYANQTVTFILTDLLSTTSNWQLNNTSTLPFGLSTSVDLRVKQTLWAQMVGLTERLPKTFFVYGGYNSTIGKHLLDVGEFGLYTGARAIQGQNILEDIQVEAQREKLLLAIEPYGGRVEGAPFNISLYDALQHTPSLASHPDYPIQTISGTGRTAVYEVHNNAASVGGKELRRYDNVKPANTGQVATAVELNACGLALWQATVQDLQKAASATQYTIVANFEDRDGMALPKPEINNLTRVYGKAQIFVTNQLTGERALVSVAEIDDALRVTKFDVDYSVSPAKWTLIVQDSDYAIDPDNSKYLNDHLESSDKLNIIGDFIYPRVTNTPAATTIGPGVGSDTTTSGGTAAKVFSFAPAGAPVSVSYFGWSLQVTPTSYVYEVFQQPALPATPLIVKVYPAGGVWSAASSATLTVTWIYM